MGAPIRESPLVVEPRIATTFSCSINLRKAAPVSSPLLWLSSLITTSFLPPKTPPFSLISSKANLTASRDDCPKVATAPVVGITAPIFTTSSSSWLPPPPPPPQPTRTNESTKTAAKTIVSFFFIFSPPIFLIVFFVPLITHKLKSPNFNL